jgi:hypothetical protein
MPIVLAFDIGIKNLAWACLQKEGSKFTLLGWDNCNLLTDSSNLDTQVQTKCSICKAKPSYTHNANLYCVRHCETLFPPLCDLSGNRLKKLPTIQVCKTILQTKHSLSKFSSSTKKEEIYNLLSNHYSLPYVPLKVRNAPDANLVTLHDSIRLVIEKQKTLWKDVTLICLENQPAFKNPTMKSVQMLLFATLRDMLQPQPPKVILVHAGKKNKDIDAEKGDGGYKERKAGTESRIESFLKDSSFSNSATWKPIWDKAKKKSDLADALCMCIDQL